LAAVASRQGHTDEAVSDYKRVLELDPSNNVAQEGLIVLLGQATPLNRQAGLKP
jgi:predicted TPR repeat methyltransferase